MLAKLANDDVLGEILQLVKDKKSYDRFVQFRDSGVLLLQPHLVW